MQEVSHKDSQSPRNQARYRNARVAKLVDARDLKSLSCEAMRVRPPPRAHIEPQLSKRDPTWRRRDSGNDDSEIDQAQGVAHAVGVGRHASSLPAVAVLLERIAPECAAHGAVPGLQAHWQSALPCPAGEHLVVQAMDFASDQFSLDAFARCAMACPPAIVRSVRKRQAEYFFGRLAARHALHQQDLVVHPDTVQIASGNAREPIWPKTAVGSISHTHRLAMSAVAPADRWRGIGIDLEHLADPDAQAALRATVVNASELALLQRLHDAGDATLDALLTLVFSAKESLFKASFAAVGRYFDFSAAQVTGVDVAAGCLQLRLCESLCPSLPAGHLCPVDFGWVDPQTVVTYRVW